MRATAGGRRSRARQKARYERGGRGIIEHEIAHPREKVLDRTQFSDCIGDPCRWLKFLFFVLSTRFDSWIRSGNFVCAALPGIISDSVAYTHGPVTASAVALPRKSVQSVALVQQSYSVLQGRHKPVPLAICFCACDGAGQVEWEGEDTLLLTYYSRRISRFGCCV